MSQPVASTAPETDPVIRAAVRLIPSRTNPVGVQTGDAAMAKAGTAATAIVPTRADADTSLASRCFVVKIDIVSSDLTDAIGMNDIPNPDRRGPLGPLRSTAERPPIDCGIPAAG